MFAGLLREGGIEDSKSQIQIAHSMVIGNYGNFNIGDEILLKEIVYRYSSLKKGDDDNNEIANIFYVPAKNTEFVDVYHPEIKELLRPLSLDSPWRIIDALRRSDKIIIGGGGIWSSYTGKLARFIPFFVLLAKIMRKRIYYESVGLYSSAPRFQRFLVNLSILLANDCSVRDNESRMMLWRRSRKRSKLVEDLSLPYIRRNQKHALLLDGTHEGVIAEYARIKNEKLSGKLIIGLSVKPLLSKEMSTKMISLFSSSIEYLNRKYSNRLFFVFFPFAETNSVIENDSVMVDEILKRANSPKNAIKVKHTHPLLWYSAIKELVDVFIGMRYHSVILTLLASKPLLCIPYENKVNEIMSSKAKDLANISMVTPYKLSQNDIIEFIAGYIR
jgi:polysaccharide pyruvyl transferase WcaK-like protein